MAPKNVEGSSSLETNHKGVPGFVRFVSPDGEVVCHTDLEMGTSHGRDALIELGCACKNELALVHYACALKWFVNHGSTICEICGYVATNIRNADFRKVLASLKDYEALRERTANGVPNPARVCDTSGVDPDAIAAIRRQRLSEIYLWFNPHCQNHYCNNNDGNIAAASLVGEAEQSSNVVVEDVTHPENPATKWAVEGAGILVATVLLTVTLAWLIAHVGKKTAKNDLHILLGAVCALAVLIFFRFIVLRRVRYGPARYWVILFVLWFLLFGIWASRTHAVHPT
uniref:RING-CH-type domain-containing protein n=1 Tax=Opuntia streptacantha TaxID=393608 RepID=A0A7C9ET25_OPUST